MTAKKRAARSGFTLIEIMIVLAVISLVLSLGLPAISRITYQQINSTTRKFVGVIRSVRNDSILLNTIYRLAFDIEHGTWWVEEQKSFQLLQEMDEETFRKMRKDKKKDAPPSNFNMAAKYSSQPLKLPSGVMITGVLKEKEGLIKDGIAYIHFFPNGLNEQAAIYLSREGSDVVAYSVLVRPIAGKVEILNTVVKDFN